MLFHQEAQILDLDPRTHDWSDLVSESVTKRSRIPSVIGPLTGFGE